MSCALLHGNDTSLINDPRPDPLVQAELLQSDRQPNVMTVEVGVGGWAFPFVVAIADVAMGCDMLMDYGNEYWHGRQAAVQEAKGRQDPRQRRRGPLP